MSEMTVAFDELYVAQTEAIGTAQVVTIGATSSIPAIIEQIPRDFINMDGGRCEKQPFRLMIKATALSSTEPAKYTAVSFTPVGSATAVALQVLSVESNNGIMHVTVGDPNAIE
jgi:hypothetical protein